MKSLLITSTFPPRVGGRELYLHSIFSRFPAGEVVVLTPREGNEYEAFDRERPYKVIRVEQDEFTWFLRGRRGRLGWFTFLGKLCLQERIDVVHCGVALPDGMGGWLLYKVLGKPYIIYTYAKEITESLSFEQLRHYRRQALIGAHRVVTISEYTKAALLRLGIAAEKIVKIHPGVDATVFYPDPEAGRAIRARYRLDERPTILTVGRLVARKGHDKVIEALPAVLQQVSQTVYIIVGTGPEEARLRALAEAHGVMDRVIFADYVPDGELTAYYNAADLLVMPNREEGEDVEGFGIVFLEANACGKPVIGGRSGGAVDAIVDGETGLVVDPYNTPAIAEAIIKLLRDPMLAQRLGDNGRWRVRRHLSWKQASQQVQDLTAEAASTSSGEVMALAHPAQVMRSLRFFMQRY